jgi:hypothetical protein
MQEHPTKLIKYNGEEAHIDVEIADLISNLWKLDLMTFNSCQDNVPKGFVWIEFGSVYDAEQFLNYVSEYSEESESVYCRITRKWGDTTDLDWQYATHIHDFGVDEELTDDDAFLETFTGKHEIHFSMSVRFPHSDLLFVEGQIRKALGFRNSKEAR